MQKRSFYSENAAIPETQFNCEMFYHRNGFLNRSQMHLHNYIEIGICTGGSGLFFIGNEVYPFTEGSVSVIDSGILHIAQSPDDRPSDWIFMNVKGLSQQTKCGSKILNTREAKYLMKILVRELEEKHSDSPVNARKLVEVLISVTNRNETKETPDYNKKTKKISPALAVIMQEYRKEIKIEDLANACHINTGYFRKLFKECIGSSPLEYINKIRLKEAAMLLKQTDLSVQEISERSGFQTLSHFNRCFLAEFETSPTKFRKQNK